MTETTYATLLERVVDDGIAAARADYTREHQKPMLEGSVAGFEACREKSPPELAALLLDARTETGARRRAEQDPENYWWARCFDLEVEWVCNVMSAALMNSGQPVIVPPTMRGVKKAAEILGVDMRA